MEILLGIGLMVGLAVLPFALLAGMASLALLIWSWGRIGRYFVNLGRWLGDWRNFVPLSILGTLIIVTLVVLWRFLLPQVGIVWIIFLVVHILVTLFCLTFAMIGWIFWFHEWFWPKYKRWLWSIFAFLFGRGQGYGRARPAARSRRVRPVAEPSHSTEPAAQQQPPQKTSVLESLWALMLGKSPKQAKPAAAAQTGAANVRPTSEGALAKLSWFGTFWALMLGKPQPKRQQARPTRVQTTDQTLGPSGGLAVPAGTEPAVSSNASSAVPRARRAKLPKRSWFSSLWSLMLGKPSKPSQRKVQPERGKTVDRADHSTQTSPAADVKSGATTRANAATSGEKPAKRGFFAGMWNSIVRGITFVVGLVILAVLWVVQKIREGIEWIRVRLNID